MTKNIRIWKVCKGENLQEIKTTNLDFEKRIQSWLEKDISLISSDLLIIGREVETAYGGFIDLLCLDRNGDVVIVELKRDKTPREVTAQALDYASWVKDLSHEKTTEIANNYFTAQGLPRIEETFSQKFNLELPTTLNTNHKILIIASEIDSSTERIINYLSETYGVGINAVTFQYFKDEDNRELLARVFLIEPRQAEQNTQIKAPSKRNPNLSYEDLQEIADKKGLGEIYKHLCDQLNSYFSRADTTRSSIAFKKGSKTIFTLIPGESKPLYEGDNTTNANALKFRVYTTRFAECFDIDLDQAIALLPKNKYDWENYPNATPEWTGHEGYFENLKDVEQFITGLSELIKK
jgi:hypothetical protein